MPWDPFGELRAWQDRLGRLAAHHADSWTPAIDIYETPDRYVLTAEVPGMTREQITLELEDSRLILRGQRPNIAADGGDIRLFHQIERGHGTFQRTFEFGEKVDAERIAADLTAGVLTILLPKVPPAPARKIDVS